MGQPAARVGDMHTCPMVNPGPVPHVGGPILPPGAINVLIGGMPAARVGDMAVCVGPPDTIVKGSMTVLIGGKPAARLGDNTAHGGVIVVGMPTVLIGDAAGGGGGTKGGGGGGGAKAPAPVPANKPAPAPQRSSPFAEDRLEGMVGESVQGEGSDRLSEAMNTLYDNRDNPDSDAVSEALQAVADERGQPLDKITSDWAKYQDLLADQRAIGAKNGQEGVPGINETFHGDFMGSRSQLRSGAVTGEVLGVDPVFGALLNPTGGLVGPGNKSVDANDSAVGYHGAVHDSAGYLYNYHDTGPGYDYLGTDSRDTSSPYSGQRNGIAKWREIMADDEDRSRAGRVGDWAAQKTMEVGVGAADLASAAKDKVVGAARAAKDAAASAWDSIFGD